MTPKRTAGGDGGPVRVLVVDDSAFMRKAITRIIDAEPDLDVVGYASTGEEALAVIPKLAPDVVTLDVVMPGIGGLETLRRIMCDHPTPVIVLTAATSENAELSVEALAAGAVEVVEKPAVYTHMNMPLIAGDLLANIRAAAGIDVTRLTANAPCAEETVERPAPAPEAAVETMVDAVVIGVSTGGPPALQKILPALPATMAVPVVVVQHMPPGFTAALAERLNMASAIEVREAHDGDLVKPGRVLFAKAGSHLVFERKGERVIARVTSRDYGTPHTPSVDVTMNSAVDVWGGRLLGVLLTGMGADGAKGMASIRRAGGMTIAEAESTAVVWGMPRAAVEAGVVDEVVPVGSVPGAIMRGVTRGVVRKLAARPR